MSRRRQVRPLDWILWSFLIFSKGHLVYSGQVHQDQTHHGWSANFGPNVMVFDDIPSSPNVKELSSFNISPMRSTQQRPEVEESEENEHFVLKFQDLPPWRPKKAASNSEESSSSVVSEFRKRRERQNKEPDVRLDLRPYNPLMSHIMSQSFVYPTSNGLTQTDRDYFAMVQSETGLSRVHFEASLELGTSTGAPEAISAEVKKIKEPKQLAPENLRCQNPGCSLQPLEEGQLNSSKDNTSSSSKITPNIISTTATTKTTTTNTKEISTTSKKTKPIPRFAYHRVPGSFASFRVIRPAVYPVATMPSFDSFHDDEPPRSEGAQQKGQTDENLQRPQRDVAAIHLVVQ